MWRNWADITSNMSKLSNQESALTERESIHRAESDHSSTHLGAVQMQVLSGTLRLVAKVQSLSFRMNPAPSAA